MINITLRAGGLTLFLFLLGSGFVLGWLNNIKSSTQQSERSVTSSSDQSCFCHLTGVLDDCFCDIESIDVFNNFKIYPKIQKLTERDFFRYYKVSTQQRQCDFLKLVTRHFRSDITIHTRCDTEVMRQVNLRRPCPFWPDDGHCSIKNCQVEPCPESKVPVGIKAGNYNKHRRWKPSTQSLHCCQKWRRGRYPDTHLEVGRRERRNAKLDSPKLMAWANQIRPASILKRWTKLDLPGLAPKFSENC